MKYKPFRSPGNLDKAVRKHELVAVETGKSIDDVADALQYCLPCVAISMRKRIPSPEIPCCMALPMVRCISTDEWVNASQSAIPE